MNIRVNLGKEFFFYFLNPLHEIIYDVFSTKKSLLHWMFKFICLICMTFLTSCGDSTMKNVPKKG